MEDAPKSAQVVTNIIRELDAMTNGEQAILSFFRRFEMRAEQMLFINNNGAVAKLDGSAFDYAMEKLIKQGLVRRDRRKHAYFLTKAGYEATLAGQPN